MAPTTSELLTPAEAAVVADVSVRNINRVFDEGLLPKRFFELKGGRWLKSDACAYVRFYFHTAPRLTADERTRVIRAVATSNPRTWVYKDDVLTVNFDRFVEATMARHDALRRAKRTISEDPHVLGGIPVFKGTRIPAHDVAASIRAGQSPERIKAAYPGLDDEMIELAVLYAHANPARGRPRTLSERDDRLALLSEKKVARRRPG
jgi:uncharacterized protein (DUF433 family)